MINKTTVGQILDAARIVDVVGEFVALKRQGINYFGCCPFHNERTPSFSVNPTLNIYKCFGCGKAGNSVNFIMEYEHLSYPDALHYLAKKYNIAFEEKEQTLEEKLFRDRRESLLVVSAYAARVFHGNLFNTHEGSTIGLGYLKERGFRDDTIKNFELGYSLEARDAFTQEALRAGYKKEFVIETGLSIIGERGVFDRFSGRVMFPIHNIAGKIIAFGGRILKTDKKAAKYLNSPESEIYHKSKVLYGIFQAKRSIVQNDRCFLVEGYTDVLSMHQAGIENVVASSGTSLTVEQIQLVKRFTLNITVVYDGDHAGMKASLRGIDLILQEGMNVKVLPLPEGEDPDSFARSHSASELETFIHTNETDFVTFKARLLLDDTKNDPIRRSQLIMDVLQSISLIPHAITRSIYLKECVRMFEMDEKLLLETMETIRFNKGISRRRTDTLPIDFQNIEFETSLVRSEQATEQKELIAAEQEIIRLMLRYGHEKLIHVDETTGEVELTVASYIIRELCADELFLTHPLFYRVFEEYRQLLCDGVTVGDMHFTQHPDPEVSRLAASFEPKYELSNIHRRMGAAIKTEKNNLCEVVSKSVLVFKNEKIMTRLKETSIAMHKAENNSLFGSLYMQYCDLTQIKKTLGLTLGKRIYH